MEKSNSSHDNSPSVEIACAMLEQEETQREALAEVQVQLESSASLGKTVAENKCSECENKGHSRGKCWLMIVYPNWHPRSKKFP